LVSSTTLYVSHCQTCFILPFGLLVLSIKVLKEPDYAEVAFGAMRLAQYKSPKDKWDKVGVALLQKNTGFVVAVAEMTGSTEQDPVARSFVHFYQYHGKGAEMLSFLIIDEVARTLDENTIFRSNSLASKVRKQQKKKNPPLIHSTLTYLFSTSNSTQRSLVSSIYSKLSVGA